MFRSSSSGQKNLRLLAGEIEQAQSCARGFALALLPTSSGGDGHIQQSGKYRLANVQLLTNGCDILWLNCPDTWRQNEAADPQSQLFLAFKMVSMIPQALQQKIWIELNLFHGTNF